MKPLLFVLFIVVGLTVAEGVARADEHALGIEPSLDVAVAELAAPSDAHAWGTIAIAWSEESSDPKSNTSQLRIGEWDLREGRFLHIETLRSRAFMEAPLVRLLRFGDVLYLANAGFPSDGNAELLRLDLALHETGHLDLGEGWLASLAVTDHFIAFGSYEHDAPGDCFEYHVRLVEPVGFTIVAARKLERPLCPWPVEQYSSHALRFEGASLLVILAEPQNPRIARLALPSLATTDSAVIAIPDHLRWGLTSAAFSPPGLPLAVDVKSWGCARLSRSLRLASVPCPTPPRGSPPAPQIGEQVVTRVYGRSVVTGVRGDPKAAGRDGEEARANEKWVLRVIP